MIKRSCHRFPICFRHVTFIRAICHVQKLFVDQKEFSNDKLFWKVKLNADATLQLEMKKYFFLFLSYQVLILSNQFKKNMVKERKA